MTPPKVHSDTDAGLLLEAMTHNVDALRVLLSLVRNDRIPVAVRTKLGIASTHIGLSQDALRQMQLIREANNPRRKRKNDEDNGSC